MTKPTGNRVDKIHFAEDPSTGGLDLYLSRRDRGEAGTWFAKPAQLEWEFKHEGELRNTNPTLSVPAESQDRFRAEALWFFGKTPDAKSQILEDAGYAYSYSHTLYVNLAAKKAFGVKFVDEAAEEELLRLIHDAGSGWRLYFTDAPSATLKRDIVKILDEAAAKTSCAT